MITNAADVAAAAQISGGAPACVKALPSSRVNVGSIERIASAATGGAMIMFGLRRRSLGGLALAFAGGSLLYRGMTGHCYIYGALGINTAHKKKSDGEDVWERGVKVEKKLIVNLPPDQLYQFWHNLENIPRFMWHVKSVTKVGDTLSVWRVEGPAGVTVTWNAEVINDKANGLIAWKSLPYSDVESAGSVTFKPAGTGTELQISLQYRPPAGKVGAAIARLFNEAPEQQIDEDLVRFKAMAESGQLLETAAAR